MAPKNPNTRSIITLSLVLTIAFSLFISPIPALAMGKAGTGYPTLSAFIQTVQDGSANTLRGVYVAGILALPVIQQPTGYPGFVSQKDGESTQFMMAAEVGNVGLLAHNHLAGAAFAQLALGQEVSLVYGNGTVETFMVTRILSYQALQPLSATSEFRDLGTKITITAEELFRLVYRGSRHVTFQTCIEKDGNLSWGRLFIIAEPVAAK